MKMQKISILMVWVIAVVSLVLISCGKEVEKQTVVTGPVVDSAASSDGVMIQYEVVGEGEPTLVFVHGLS